MLAPRTSSGAALLADPPPCYAPARLERNLATLWGIDRSLAERLCLPVVSEHVRFEPDGRAHLWLHTERVPLDLVPRLEGEAAAVTPPAELPAEVLAFGVGTGEHLGELLAQEHVERIVAWEPDPWLLRLFLMRHDVADALAAGRLVLRLGADLVHEARRGERALLVPHPLLGALHARERRLYERGAAGPIALLAGGGLFVEALGRALEAAGYDLFTIQLERVAEEELDHGVEILKPALIAMINYIEGVAEFAHARALPVLCWEIDPRTADPRPPAVSCEHVGLFTWRRESVPAWRRAGFARAEHLPLAADPAERHPVVLEADERERYAAPCALVGSSMVEQARTYRALILGLLCAWRGGEPGIESGEAAALEELLAAQRADPTRWRIPELLERRMPGFLEFARARSRVHDPLLLLGEIAGAEKRLTYAANLGRLGLRVFGDTGWRATEAHGVRYMGPAGHRFELNRVYCGVAINIDIGRIYQQDIVTMRVFDVLACGGFVLAEHSAELEQLFDVGLEVESYRTLGELCAKTEHYLAHPEAAAAIAARGREAVLTRHRVDQRVATMLAAVPRLAAAARVRSPAAGYPRAPWPNAPESGGASLGRTSCSRPIP